MPHGGDDLFSQLFDALPVDDDEPSTEEETASSAAAKEEEEGATTDEGAVDTDTTVEEKDKQAEDVKDEKKEEKPTEEKKGEGGQEADEQNLGKEEEGKGDEGNKSGTGEKWPGGSGEGEEEGEEEEDEDEEEGAGKGDASEGEGEGADEKEGDKKIGDSDEGIFYDDDDGDPEKIAREILDMVIEETDRIVNEAKSLDSLVLDELRETEAQANELAKKLAEKKKEIKKIREKDPLSQQDINEIEDKQLEIQEMIEEFERLAAKMKELLENSLRPSTLPKPEVIGVCPLCGRENCICQMHKEDEIGAEDFVCVCEEDVCICEEESKSYIPGLWLEQQVADLFPLSDDEEELEEDKECVCKKEDLEQFNLIADVMPKVVVCAPDVSLPRIIVCEPYIPLKPRPRKPHVCEPNRACKLYKYPGF